LIVAVVFVGLALVRVAPIDVSGLSRHAPERSALMKQREREARQKGRAYHESQEWVSLDRISPHLRDAVLVAEDARFFSHEGFDWNEIRESAKRNLRAKRVVAAAARSRSSWRRTCGSPPRRRRGGSSRR
jgi:monofunctional biosynthetic peptidoglycan transglycosylase